MKYKFALEKAGKYLMKIEMNDGDDKWMTTTKEVMTFVKATFKEGDEIGLDYIEKNGQFHVSKVNKDGKVSSTKESSEDTVSKSVGFTCEDCGKELKDGKYKKCFLCNKKNPTKKTEKTSSKGLVCEDCGKELKDDKYKKCYTCNKKNPVKNENNYSTKSPETQESIKIQSAYKISAIALGAFTGQIADLDTLKAQLTDLAEFLKEKF